MRECLWGVPGNAKQGDDTGNQIHDDWQKGDQLNNYSRAKLSAEGDKDKYDDRAYPAQFGRLMGEGCGLGWYVQGRLSNR